MVYSFVDMCTRTTEETLSVPEISHLHPPKLTLNKQILKAILRGSVMENTSLASAPPSLKLFLAGHLAAFTGLLFVLPRYVRQTHPLPLQPRLSSAQF
jgi:hypothetical protein